MRRVLGKVAIIVSTCLVIAVPAHYYISDRLGVLRFIYPVEAQLVEWSTVCSPQAPAWMKISMSALVWSRASPGNQMVYISPEGEQYSCVNGWMDIPLMSPRISQDSRFRYASVTKLFTADAVLDLMVEGRLRLDMRVVDLLPELQVAKDARYRDITIQHLLRHQAGFDRYKTPDPMFERYQLALCPFRLPELANVELDFTPGERFEYSNLGYCLLGAVIERLTGEKFRSYLDKKYRLSSSRILFIDGPYLEDEVSYDFRNQNFYGPRYWRYYDFLSLSSSAGLSGSAQALAAKVRLLRQRQPSIFSYSFADSCSPSSDPKHRCYGFAPLIDARKEHKMVLYRQSGSLVSAVSDVIVDSEGGVLVWLGKGRPLSRAQARSFDRHHFYGQLRQWYGLE